MFLKHLVKLHNAFPKLKIVLEHATSKEAVDLVKSLGSSVGCTITIHHLKLVVDDWAMCCHNYCKPVAKFPHDRDALRNVILEGHPRFFLGTDSAPHPKEMKEGKMTAAGVFVTPYTSIYLASVLESFGALHRLEDFATKFGRQFYGLPAIENKDLSLLKGNTSIPNGISFKNDLGKESSIVPFLAGQVLDWKQL